MSDFDAIHMKEALLLAAKAGVEVEPNPKVGAVIVKNGVRIGQGFHHEFGGPHAEVQALHACKEDPTGATLYVTLEPCDHQGKTGPCTKAIIEAGIARVVIASKDPQRNGAEILKQHGVQVEFGIEEQAARELNKVYFTFHEQQRPFITVKIAMSLDGKISTERGKQTWLTGEMASRHVHRLRHEHQAVLVGAGTLLSDDPHLGVRSFKGRDPLRVTLQGERALPSHLKFFRDENYLILKENDSLHAVEKLQQRGLQSLLVEGGQEVFSSFLEARLFDELHCLIAPKILGSSALPFLGENTLKDGLSLMLKSTHELDSGDTLLVFTR